MKLLRTLITQVFREKWENLLGIVGLVASLGSVSSLLVAVYAVFIVALTWDLALFIINSGRELREKHVPLLVVAGRTTDEFVDMAQVVWDTMQPQRFDLAKYTRHYDVDRSDLSVHRAEDMPVRMRSWSHLVHELEEKMIRLNRRLQGEKVYHLFLNCPAALAVGLGAVLRMRYPLLLYHYQRGQGPYRPVIDLTTTAAGPQALHRRADSLRYTSIIEPEEIREQLIISVHLAFSDPLGDATELAEKEGAAVAHIRNEYGNVLDGDDDWLQVTQEVVTTISRWIALPNVRGVGICLSAPLPIACAIGMALGTTSNVTVYHWFQRDHRYRPVLRLDALR